jgi:flavin reductase ActVB
MGTATDRPRAEQTIAALYDAYNRHDPAAAAALYAPDGTHEDIAQTRRAEGPDAVREGLTKFFTAFPDAGWEAEHIVGTEQHATSTYRLTGTLQGQLGPFQPAGQQLDLRGAHVVQTDEQGRIEFSIDYWDGGALAKQLAVPAVETGTLPAVAPDGFRHAMRLLAGGVAVVTTVVDGRPWGMTVSACCSLTADPPQVLISLDHRTQSCRAILETGRFGVALLGSDQIDVARACSVSGKPKFIEGLTDGGFEHAGSPVIANALAQLDCRVTDTHHVGDHRLLIGLVQDVISPRTDEELEPLVYFERAFRTTSVPLA